MNKKRITAVILLICGLGILLSGTLSGPGTPEPTSFIKIEPASGLDESLPCAVLTEADRETFPVLFHAMENGITRINVYYPDVPKGGMTEREYYAISNLYEVGIVFYTGPGYILYDNTVYQIYIGDIGGGGSGFEETLAGLLKSSAWILIAAGTVLTAVSFVRSLSSTAPESRTMQIQNHIENHPGCSEADIIKTLGYSRNSTVHHLKKLLRDNRIRKVSYHKTIRYFPAGIPEKESDIRGAAQAKEKPARIISALERKPLTLAELEEETGLSSSSLRWHLARLEEDGIVTPEKTANSVRYFLSR